MKTGIAMSLVAVATAAALSGGATAQTQTAEGAQKFLAKVADGNNVKAFVVGDVDVNLSCAREGSYSYVACTPEEVSNTGNRKKRLGWQVRAIEMGESACSTRATSFPVPAPESSLIGDQRVTVRFVSEPVILVTDVDWSSANIKRGGWTGAVGFYGQAAWHPEDTRFLTVEAGQGKALEFASDDPEMLDRIEYAMKFLKASCDKNADTGF